jgi:hypothetical protein
MKRPLSLCIAVFLASCSVGPSSLLRSQAYEGPARPSTDVAMLFATHRGIDTYFALVCQVDGKEYQRMGAISNCPSVVYLAPGKHRIGLQTRYANLVGNHELSVEVVAGRVYEIVMTPKTTTTVEYAVAAKPEGFLLTYKDLAPFMYRGSNTENGPVPFAPN